MRQSQGFVRPVGVGRPYNLIMLNVDHITHDFGVGTAGNVLIISWYRHTTLEALDLIDEVVEQLLVAHPKGFVQLVTVHQQALLPGSEERTRLNLFHEYHASQTLAAGVVIDGQGFVASAKRGVVTGLSLLLRQPYPLIPVARLDQAVDRLFKLDAVSAISRADLIAASLKVASFAPWSVLGSNNIPKDPI